MVLVSADISPFVRIAFFCSLLSSAVDCDFFARKLTVVRTKNFLSKYRMVMMIMMTTTTTMYASSVGILLNRHLSVISSPPFHRNAEMFRDSQNKQTLNLTSAVVYSHHINP